MPLSLNDAKPRFQSTLPVRGATVLLTQLIVGLSIISIHAPREGSDGTLHNRSRSSMRTISIHAPREGSDSNIKAEHGRHHWISIHAPRAGSDRRATDDQLTHVAVISIHAPRAGSDAMADTWPHRQLKFQSTLPVRGATAPGVCVDWHTLTFQSTLPVRGATQDVAPMPDTCTDFNPRSPCGERHGISLRAAASERSVISIHAPREGSDRHRSRPLIAWLRISIHAPREGSDMYRLWLSHERP